MVTKLKDNDLLRTAERSDPFVQNNTWPWVYLATVDSGPANGLAVPLRPGASLALEPLATKTADGYHFYFSRAKQKCHQEKVLDLFFAALMALVRDSSRAFYLGQANVLQQWIEQADGSRPQGNMAEAIDPGLQTWRPLAGMLELAEEPRLYLRMSGISTHGAVAGKEFVDSFIRSVGHEKLLKVG